MGKTKRFLGLCLGLFILADTVGFQPQRAEAGGSNILYLPFITVPSLGPNLLSNPSFEEGWYHPDGIPELQIPAGWQFKNEVGENPLDPDEWNEWVRPEVRVLSSAFLPPEEHDLFIWDGDQTVKVFKGSGAISFELTTAVTLQPGTYRPEDAGPGPAIFRGKGNCRQRHDRLDAACHRPEKSLPNHIYRCANANRHHRRGHAGTVGY